MSVSNIAVKQRYQGDGVNTTFAIPFAFIAGTGQASIKVYFVTYDANGVATERLASFGALLDYFLDPLYNSSSGIDNQNVIMNIAPSATTQILVIRSMPLTQITSFMNTGPTFLKTVENCIDVLTFLVQQNDERLQRAPKFRKSGTFNDLHIPDPPTGVTKLWAFDPNGNIELLLPTDVAFQAAFTKQVPFVVPMNTVSQILTGESFDGLVYSSVIYEIEIQQGLTVISNVVFQLQCLNGVWQKVPRGDYDNGTPHAVTFGLNQVGTVVQLLATEGGVADAKIKVKKQYFLQS